MLVWLLPLIERFLLPLILQELVKAGVLSKLEAAAITSVEKFVSWVGSLKTYSEYPAQKEGAFDIPPPAQGMENGNFNKG